jgi:hypothetical protein
MTSHLRCVTCTSNSVRFPLRGQIERAFELMEDYLELGDCLLASAK